MKHSIIDITNLTYNTIVHKIVLQQCLRKVILDPDHVRPLINFLSEKKTGSRLTFLELDKFTHLERFRGTETVILSQNLDNNITDNHIYITIDAKDELSSLMGKFYSNYYLSRDRLPSGKYHPMVNKDL